MAAKKINQLPLTNVEMVQIITKESEPVTYQFDTSDEVKTEEVVSEGEEQTLKIKGIVRANIPQEDTVLGYDLSFKDNVMCPELLEVMQGGTITYDADGTTFKSYEAPKIGVSTTKKKFNTVIYSKEVGTDGATGRYAKVTFPSCQGASVPLEFKDGEYYSNEYTVKSRPAKGESPYKIEIVDALPSA